MNERMVPYLYVFMTIALTVYGQFAVKIGVAKGGQLPELFGRKVLFLLKLLFEPSVFSGLVAAFVAAMFWMAAMTRLELSVAYPLVSLTFVLVVLLSGPVLGESVTLTKVLGVSLIVAGTFVASR